MNQEERKARAVANLADKVIGHSPEWISKCLDIPPQIKRTDFQDLVRHSVIQTMLLDEALDSLQELVEVSVEEFGPSSYNTAMNKARAALARARQEGL